MKVIWWFVGLLQTKKHVKILSIHRWGGLKFFHVYNYFRNEIVRTKFIHTINFVEILSLSNANNKRKKLFKCRVHYVHLYLEKKFFINFVPSISKLPTEIIIMNFNFNWPINKLHSSNLLNEYFFVNFIFHYVIFINVSICIRRLRFFRSLFSINLSPMERLKNLFDMKNYIFPTMYPSVSLHWYF